MCFYQIGSSSHLAHFNLIGSNKTNVAYNLLLNTLDVFSWKFNKKHLILSP